VSSPVECYWGGPAGCTAAAEGSCSRGPKGLVSAAQPGSAFGASAASGCSRHPLTPNKIPLPNTPQVKANKRYAGAEGFTISECAAKVARDSGKIDIMVGLGCWVLGFISQGLGVMALGFGCGFGLGLELGLGCGAGRRSEFGFGCVLVLKPARFARFRGGAITTGGEATPIRPPTRAGRAPPKGPLPGQRPRGREAAAGDEPQGLPRRHERQQLQLRVDAAALRPADEPGARPLFFGVFLAVFGCIFGARACVKRGRMCG
jgi:hypothetical protein